MKITVGGESTRRPDTLAVEEPLEIRVGGTPLAVTMRTPGHDVELAAGFLVSEGVISRGDEFRSAIHCGGPGTGGLLSPIGRGDLLQSADGASEGNTYNVLDVSLAPGVAPPDPDLARSFYTTSSCGLCGKASIDAVETVSAYDVAADDVTMDAATVVGAARPAAGGADRVRQDRRAARAPRCSTPPPGSSSWRARTSDATTPSTRSIGWAVLERPAAAARDGAAGVRPGELRTRAEGRHGRHPDAHRGVGTVVARGRTGRGIRAHARRIRPRSVDERLLEGRPHHGRRARDRLTLEASRPRVCRRAQKTKSCPSTRIAMMNTATIAPTIASVRPESFATPQPARKGTAMRKSVTIHQKAT